MSERLERFDLGKSNVSQSNYGLYTSLNFHLRQTAQTIEQRVEKHLQLFSLTRLEWHVLCAVFGEGTVRPSQIADYVGANRTQISRALRVLETKGLLTRGLGRDDRRSTEIILTEHGKEKIRTVLPGWRKANLHFHAKLGDEDLDELLRLLCKLTNNEVG